ncbi:MAG: heterocyst frequency control protein PatD [Cyanobacteria bacterium J06614_10]
MELCERIGAFGKSLETFERCMLAAPETIASEKLSLAQQAGQLRAQFQQIITDLAEADISREIEQRIQPYQTEAHRRLRLLGVEAMRLRTARDPARLAAVRSQLQDHLKQLQQFTSAIATEVCPQADS